MRIAESASIFGAALSEKVRSMSRLQRQASRPGHGAGHLVCEFRRELLGSNTLALQSAAISPNIGQRFLRRRDRIHRILDLRVDLITREPGLGFLPVGE